MATLSLIILKVKVLKDRKHKIRIAVRHKHETSYIIIRFIIDSESQFKNGQIVKRPDAAVMNTKLRNLLNAYQEKLDNIYDCKQLRQLPYLPKSANNRKGSLLSAPKPLPSTHRKSEFQTEL